MFLDMFSEITQLVPAMSRERAKTLINRAWKIVQDSSLWSFQLGQGGFSTPQLTSAGSISATIGSNQLIGDATATAAWLALPLYWAPTLQQIRAQGFSIYSIISMNGNGSIASVTVISPGSGQTPGTYVVNVTDVLGGLGSGATIQVIVGSNGMVNTPPVVLTPGANYTLPLIQFIQGNATFQAVQIQVLTLDRPFIDPLPFFTGVGYQMFMAYIPAPPRFKRWLTIADMFNCWALDIWTSRRTIDLTDPCRLYTSNPSIALPLGQDQRGAGTANQSATFGQQLYELYPNPQTQISYQTYYVAEAPYLVLNTDTLPSPIDEELVTQKALTWAYRDAEARRDIMAAKGTSGNYLGLKKSSEDDFLTRLKTLRLLDRDAVDSYMVDMRKATSGFRGLMPYFNPLSGTANMGLGGWR